MQTDLIDFFSLYLLVACTESFPQETVMYLKIEKENKQQNEDQFFPFSCMSGRHLTSKYLICNFFYHLLNNNRTREVRSPSGHNGAE